MLDYSSLLVLSSVNSATELEHLWTGDIKTTLLHLQVYLDFIISNVSLPHTGTSLICIIKGKKTPQTLRAGAISSRVFIHLFHRSGLFNTCCYSLHSWREEKNQLKACPLRCRVKSHGRWKTQGVFFFSDYLPECFSQQPQSSQELISCSKGFTKQGQRRRKADYF